MNDSVYYPATIIGAVAILGLALLIFDRNQTPLPREDAPAGPQIAASTPLAQASSQAGGGRSDISASSVPQMRGVSVVGGNGQYYLNAIRVAVPGQYDEIEHLPGTDPRAIRYLQDQEAAHGQLTVDNGPLNVDTSSLPPPGTFSNQPKRVRVIAKTQ